MLAELDGPPLKWAGGKRWLVSTLRGIWRGHEEQRLVEPFVGGLAVALGLRPRRALLYDSNPHLINFYHQLQRGLVATIAMENDRALYYRQRERFNALIDAGEAASSESAALFYYLNRTCFNGLCRFNRRGAFNVPFGRYNNIRYRHDFTAYAEILAGWEFQTGDFSRIELAPDDFIYADPPYDVPFTSYSPGGFSWNDQIRLVGWLAAHNGPVVTSNQATSRVLDLYSTQGFNIATIPAPRMISRNGNRTPALEMLAMRGLDEWEGIREQGSVG